MDTVSFLLASLSVYLPELWILLEARERPQRVCELHTDAWSNLPAARYLYDNIDFEVSEIRELKLTLKHLHRSAITHLLLFMVIVTATVAAWL